MDTPLKHHRKILMATDFSASAETALAQAVYYAAQGDGECKNGPSRNTGSESRA